MACVVYVVCVITLTNSITYNPHHHPTLTSPPLSPYTLHPTPCTDDALISITSPPSPYTPPIRYTDDALISITYNRPINETWVEAATELAAKLGGDVKIVGRSRKVRERVRERGGTEGRVGQGEGTV